MPLIRLSDIKINNLFMNIQKALSSRGIINGYRIKDLWMFLYFTDPALRDCLFENNLSHNSKEKEEQCFFLT
jgi:hypothetical protein